MMERTFALIIAFFFTGNLLFAQNLPMVQIEWLTATPAVIYLFMAV